MTTITLKELSQGEESELETIFSASSGPRNVAVLNLNNKVVRLLADGQDYELHQEEMRVLPNVQLVQAFKGDHMTVLLTVSSQDPIETCIEYAGGK